MFFQLDEATLRKIAEKFAEAKAAKEAEEAKGPKIRLGADGVPFIDDPSLVTLTSTRQEAPSREDLHRTDILTQIGWVPLREHPLWRD